MFFFWILFLKGPGALGQTLRQLSRFPPSRRCSRRVTYGEWRNSSLVGCLRDRGPRTPSLTVALSSPEEARTRAPVQALGGGIHDEPLVRWFHFSKGEVFVDLSACRVSLSNEHCARSRVHWNPDPWPVHSIPKVPIGRFCHLRSSLSV